MGGTVIALTAGDESPPSATAPANPRPPAPQIEPASENPPAAATTAAPTTPPAPAPPPPAPVPALPSDRVYEGRGSKVVRLKLADNHVHIATITHQGSSNFIVESVDSTGDMQDLLVNEIGRYSGVRPLDFEAAPTALKIDADGKWRIVVRVGQKAPMWSGKASGKGSAVLRINPDSVQTLPTVKFTHQGSGNFIVYAYGDSQDLLVNEIGRYSGETLLPGGASFVEIQADGAWTFVSS